MSASTLTPRPEAMALTAPVARARSSRHGRGFWFVAFAFLVAMAFSTVPTPLYPLYAQRDGFSTFTVTVVFAVYAVGVVASLLLAGHVSDWVGRRKVMLAALVLELAAAVVFLLGSGLTGLILARVLTGLGIGMVTATATAHLHELHGAHRPGASVQRFQVVSTAANLGGLGAGTLIAGVLAEWFDAPLRTPYLVFAGLVVIAILAVALAPETVEVQPLRPAYRPQRVGAGHVGRAHYLGAAAAAFAAFSIFGMFTSVAPGFVAGQLHHTSRALAGAIVFVVFAAGAVAQTLTSRLAPKARRPVGAALQALGLVLVALAMWRADLGTFVTGGIVAGMASGLLFKDAVGAMVASASPQRRGEALAGLFLFAYLGLIVPSLAIGVAMLVFPAVGVMTGYAAVSLLLLAGVGVVGRSAPTPPAPFAGSRS